MTHIDEHTIELYVLNAQEVTYRREEIEAHLHECHGCRALAEEMSNFHKDLAEEIKHAPVPAGDENRALVRANGSLKLYEQLYTIPASRFQRGPMERFRGFVRRHPVVSGAGGFVAVGSMAAAIIFGVYGGIKDKEPFFADYDSARKTMVIYNAERQMTHEFPMRPDVTPVVSASTGRLMNSVIVDLNGDGRRELLTTAHLIGDPWVGTFRIFDASYKEVVHQSFNVEFRYRGRLYPTQFSASSIVAIPASAGKQEEVFVDAENRGYSPAFIVRMDHNSQVIGRYWHFGAMMSIDTISLFHDGRHQILVAGVNNTKDSTWDDFAFVAVLDPTKIVGDKKSTTSDGFGFPLFSDAEMYYIQLPTIKLNASVQRGIPNAMDIEFVGPDRWSVVYYGDNESSVYPTFRYIFTNDMAVLDVKSSDANNLWYEQLRGEGKIKDQITQAYRDDLKRRVRYWDGKEWRKEVVRVEHSVSNP